MCVDCCLRQPIAMWNDASGVWVTDQVSLLCGHSVLFLATWPVSGMTLDGRAFEPLTLVHHITGSGSLSSPIPEESMFRTPQAKEGEGGAIFEDVKRDRGNHV